MSRPVLALLLLAVFHAVAFGLRTWQHLRATGSTGFHGVSGRPGSAEWLGGALFAVAVALGLAAPIAALLGWTSSGDPGPLAAALGLALTLLGISATYASQLGMGDAWRIGVKADDRTRLVVRGPFAVVRNPIFSCMLLTALGLAIFLPNALARAAFVCLLVAVELQVRRVEEPHLERVHGQAYRDYMARVGRLVPGLGLRR